MTTKGLQSLEPGKGKATYAVPFSAETASILNGINVEDGTIPDLSESPTLVLPIINAGLSSTDFVALNGFPVEEQLTWMLPVVKVAKKTASPFRTDEYPLTLMRNLIKNSGIYAIASLTSPFISLILAPFLAYHLSHTDYGVLAVLNTVISLVAGITQLGLGSSFFRAYGFDYVSQHDRLGVLSTVVVLLVSVSGTTALTIVLTAPMLSTLLFGTASFSNPVLFAALAILLQNLALPGLSWLRAENRALFFSVLSIANLLATLGANIVLVGILHWGITGSLIAVGVGYAVIALATLPVILLRAGVLLRFDIAKGLLAFGVPNVANFVSVWVLQLSDRYLLGHLGTLAETANYAVAYSLGGVLSSVVIAPFSLAWPAVMFAIAKRNDATEMFRHVFLWFSIILLFATFGLSLIGIGVLNVLFPHTYASATPIIPIIAVSIMFYGIYVIFTIGVSVQRKTWFAVIFTTLSALVNVGLNLILIRLYGSMGAALSTLLAYMVLAGVAYVVNQRIYPIAFQLRAFVAALLIGIVLYVGSDFVTQFQETYVAWSLHIIALLLYGGCLVLLGKFVSRGSKNSL